MADPHVFVEPSSSAEIDLAALASGFVEPAFEVSGATLGKITVDGSTATYVASKAGVEYIKVAIADKEGSKWSRSLGVAVFKGAASA